MNKTAQKLAVIRNTFYLPIVKVVPRWLTPNMLTSARLALVIPIIYCIINGYWTLFVIIYAFSLFSDGLDGVLSRQRNLRSEFGAKYDPVVDKILHTVLFIFAIPFSPVALSAIIVLDLIIMFGGWVAISLFKKNNRVLPIKGANIFGKIKVFAQGLLVIALYAQKIAPQTDLIATFAIILINTCLIFSVASIFHYALSLRRA